MTKNKIKGTIHEIIIMYSTFILLIVGIIMGIINIWSFYK